MPSNNFLSLSLTTLLIGLVSFNQYTYQKEASSSSLADHNSQPSVFKSLDPAPAVSDLPLPESLHKNLLAALTAHLQTDTDAAETKSVTIPAPPLPDITATSSLVYNLTTHQTILAQNPDLRWPLASLTKLMTAVVAMETISSDAAITISPAAVLTPEISGDFSPAEEFSVRDLILSMFLVSSNDAAAALAEAGGGNQFLELMNARAAALGLSATSFTDPTGLSPKNLSTGQDLKNLLEYIYTERPELIYFSRQPFATITDLAFNRTKTYQSINQFAGRPDFIGGKTGYTEAARGNLVSIFSRQNQAILIIVLGTDDRFGDTEKLLRWYDSLSGSSS